ncbi:hypothetical protein EUBDOL_00175 [Amedibacillus dolichus DSM 3991]|uniref:Uncharacterized protein n=1 Tax=Amedibacillus dolichus DSM 3991 TaxID=428127 RepID=A8R842_9FIRM|nr:hypothetical protein EUBDOL_00175 [Amedibacillus dolichus DSM 3991]
MGEEGFGATKSFFIERAYSGFMIICNMLFESNYHIPIYYLKHQ